MEIRIDVPCACGHTTSQHELRAGGVLGCIIVGCLCTDYTNPSLAWHLGRWEGASAAVEARTAVPMSVSDARALAAQIDPDGSYGPYEGDRLGWCPPTPDAIARDLELTPEGATLTAEAPELVVDHARGWLAGRDLLWAPALFAAALKRLGRLDAALGVELEMAVAVDQLHRLSEARR